MSEVAPMFRLEKCHSIGGMMRSAKRRESVARTMAEVYGLNESLTAPDEANMSASMVDEVSVVVVAGMYVCFTAKMRPGDSDSCLVSVQIW